MTATAEVRELIDIMESAGLGPIDTLEPIEIGDDSGIHVVLKSSPRRGHLMRRWLEFMTPVDMTIGKRARSDRALRLNVRGFDEDGGLCVVSIPFHELDDAHQVATIHTGIRQRPEDLATDLIAHESRTTPRRGAAR